MMMETIIRNASMMVATALNFKLVTVTNAIALNEENKILVDFNFLTRPSQA